MELEAPPGATFVSQEGAALAKVGRDGVHSRKVTYFAREPNMITQMRIDERGKTYLEHRRAAGDTKTGAIRARRRRISDEVYRRMRHDERLRVTRRVPLAAAA